MSIFYLIVLLGGLVFFLYGKHFLFGFFDDVVLSLRNVHVEYARGDRADSGVLVTESLYLIEDFSRASRAALLKASRNYLGKVFFAYEIVDFEF